MIGQPWMDTLSAMLEACNTRLSHRWIIYMQFQGAALFALLAAGWACSGAMRLRELRRVQSANRTTAGKAAVAKVADKSAAPGWAGGAAAAGQPQRQQHPQHQQQQQQRQPLQASGTRPLASSRGSQTSLASLGGSGNSDDGGVASAVAASEPGGWPAVSVVLPVKGRRPHSEAAWASQLAIDYDGPLEYLFVVDDAKDAACPPLHALFAERKGVNARLLIAPHAAATSQKIRNILAGVAAADGESRYILCLDDDIVVHPTALSTLVAGLEADDSVCMATGYPFDVPPEGAGMLTHCMLAYHLPLLIAFSIRQRTSFVWGGCMLFPADALRADTHGITQAWADGGYSDDLIVAAKCGEAGLAILCPSSSVFRQSLVADPPLRTYWNYLRRQLFVMDTYASPHNRRVNHTMLALHCYLSWALVAPLLTASTRLAVWAGQIVLLPTQHIYGGPGTSWDWLSRFGGGSGSGRSASGMTGGVATGAGCGGNAAAAALSAAACLLAFTAAAAALRWMTGVVLALLAALNPGDSSPARPSAFCWPKVWAGFLANNAVLPVCATYTFLAPHVDWSGSRYWKRRGRVVRVQRRKQ